jgi:hypothetical protein
MDAKLPSFVLPLLVAFKYDVPKTPICVWVVSNNFRVGACVVC